MRLLCLFIVVLLHEQKIIAEDPYLEISPKGLYDYYKNESEIWLTLYEYVDQFWNESFSKEMVLALEAKYDPICEQNFVPEFMLNAKANWTNNETRGTAKTLYTGLCPYLASKAHQKNDYVYSLCEFEKGHHCIYSLQSDNEDNFDYIFDSFCDSGVSPSVAPCPKWKANSSGEVNCNTVDILKIYKGTECCASNGFPLYRSGIAKKFFAENSNDLVQTLRDSRNHQQKIAVLLSKEKPSVAWRYTVLAVGLVAFLGVFASIIYFYRIYQPIYRMIPH